MPALVFILAETQGFSESRRRLQRLSWIVQDSNAAREESSPLASEKDFSFRSKGRSDFIKVYKEFCLDWPAEGLFVSWEARRHYGLLQKQALEVGSHFKAPTICLKRIEELQGLYLSPPQTATEIRDRFLRVVPHWQKDSLNQAIAQSKEAPHFSGEDIEKLSDKTGVYVISNDRNQVLYVGKANDIRKRIKQHFASDTKQSREGKIKAQCARIETHLCGSELVALLLEAELIKTLKPIYNRTQRSFRNVYGVYQLKSLDQEVYLSLMRIGPDVGTPLRAFRSYAHALRFLESLRSQLQICDERIRPASSKPIETLKKGRPCFSFQVGRCAGLCLGKVSEQAFEKSLSRFQSRSSSEAQIIIGPGPSNEVLSLVWIEDGLCLGWGYFPSQTPLSFKALEPYLQRYPERPETQRLIRRYLRQKSHFKVIESSS
jgi:predicted GIY-YIG superfamily endonuclease